MLAVPLQFHDEMRACVRPGDGVCSDWSDVEQELWRGCVLSPLLFNIFFAAVMTVVLHRFSKDNMVILAELVHLKKQQTLMASEPAMDYVRRAMWGMLYADDSCIVSWSSQGLAEIMDVIVEVCRTFALAVSAKKTEIMGIPPPRIPRTMVRVETAGQIYKQVQSFNYLRGAVKKKRTCSLKSPGGPTDAGCASGGTFLSSTTSRK